MTNRKDIVERRKHKRFQVLSGTFVALLPDYVKLGQIIDISMGGLAFRYMAGREPSRGLYLDMFSSDKTFYLGKIPFETISDFETQDVPFSSLATRRCGVQFGELTHIQTSQLEYFIQNHTIVEMQISHLA